MSAEVGDRVEVARLEVSSKALATRRGLLGDRADPQTLEADRGGAYAVFGLDVHKKTISVATVEGVAGAEVRFYGTIENTPEALRKLSKKLSQGDRQLHFCYEAGPCG